MKYRQKEPRYGNWNTSSDSTDSVSASKQAFQICQGKKKKRKEKELYSSHIMPVAKFTGVTTYPRNRQQSFSLEKTMSSLESAVKLC